MFTGIVEELGRVKSAASGRLAVAARTVLEGTKLGDSISVNGACLTVTAIQPGGFTVDVMSETLRRTNLGSLLPGDMVNLERAMALGGRLGGHLVQGHVDGAGKLLSLTPEGQAVIARISAPVEIMRYVVEKGFICVDGVSLTVVERDASSFSVSLVGYTFQHTNLGRRRPGDSVNLEVDIIAKYVEQHLSARGGAGVTADLLAQHGFTSHGRT